VQKGKRDFVSQSTSAPHPDDRAVLFQRGGELSEFSDLLKELAMPVDELSSGFPNPEELEGARLVIVSGKRLLESGTPNLSLWPRTIAVIDDSSRTLVTHLNRIGVAMVIRRPIHPRALRLLLLHEIYRGPERRVRKRVLIGHPIHISAGLFRTPATLLELSPTGARIELANAPKVGAKIRILIGKDLTKTKPVRLQARVIRSIRVSGENSLSRSEIGVAILGANHHLKTIKAVLSRFARSPAKWKTNAPHSEPHPRRPASTTNAQTTDNEISHHLPPTHVPSTTTTAPSKAATRIDAELLDSAIAHEHTLVPAKIGVVAIDPRIPDELEGHSGDTTNDEINDSPEKSPGDAPERRHDVRIPYDERVVALGEEAARVLVGRDLSAGGMRIAATSSVAVGDVLRVALHSGTESEPLIVLASNLRNDGDDGLVLSFEALSKSQQGRLDEIIASGLPVHANGDALEDPSALGDAIVVAEMLDTINPESDAEIEAHIEFVFDTSKAVEDAL